MMPDDRRGVASGSRGATLELLLLIFFAAHVWLALAMVDRPRVATLHAQLMLLLGIIVTAVSSRPQRAVYFGAYFVGAEVLWRMSHAAIFWEFGKYATAVVLIIALVRLWHQIRWWRAPIVYFCILLPSIWVTLVTLHRANVASEISFNLSGPFLLAVSCIVCSAIPPGSIDLRGVAAAIIAPVLGICARAATSTFIIGGVQFGRGSNWDSSGGFGPNQVSAALGLGAVAALLYVMDRRSSIRVRVLMGGIALVLLAQAALTLSRGGLYGAVGAVVMGAMFLVRDYRRRGTVLIAGAALIGLTAFVILPRLDTFTGGALAARLQNTSTTHRADILMEDLRAWADHPVLGAGPGGSDRYHFDHAAAHTEYTRLMAEHGILGFCALLALFYMGTALTVSARSPARRALVVTLVTWSFLFMVHSAMRLAAPAFVFGLAAACGGAFHVLPDRLVDGETDVMEDLSLSGTA